MKQQEVLATKQPMTVEAYIEFEEQSEIRHEFINGNLIPMPGTTADHNEICINIVQLLRANLQGNAPFKIHQENVKLQITSEKDYTYPDVVVVTDPRDFENQYIKKYPSVIFEVLSKNSRIEDSADKFFRYKNIESLQNYILVDSEKVFVEVRIKLENGDWEAATYLQADKKFPIPALGLELDLRAVYEGVRFYTKANKG
ncbi:MAG: Uma2 family endonuclease [Saprospiraceae bacterium]|nr:Uma2 family endonuclease [Lewinellaceae bacterium]